MSAPTSLCPGYKQVESFGPDDEYESGEEISYVTLDLGNIEPTLVPSSSTYRLIGLDTPTPFLQLSGTVLKGRHDALLGTELLFTDEKDVTDRNKRSVTHIANTEQRISFKEVRLQPINAVGESGSQTDPVVIRELAIGGSQARPSRVSKKDASVKSRKPRKRDTKGKAKATEDQIREDDAQMDVSAD
ncbi:hypothetical protein AMATHDRAFT_6330 [Amanita thiersii Skay4041]|uniref:Transcription factor TFIIIC triple barrel domain-containing protein n=1 Tax=Amanita thiersii Skay4041 TaxID=703135 RepID=A0A2A9NJL8_9AGAR|nr:hypothetical protein AMATHDRAFT_6330 [Amanita thiersii Skay4041]